jgi:hypothetical protein
VSAGRSRERDRLLWEEEKRKREEEDESREATERRGEELKEAWRNRHPERKKDRPKKPD